MSLRVSYDPPAADAPLIPLVGLQFKRQIHKKLMLDTSPCLR